MMDKTRDKDLKHTWVLLTGSKRLYFERVLADHKRSWKFTGKEI